MTGRRRQIQSSVVDKNEKSREVLDTSTKCTHWTVVMTSLKALKPTKEKVQNDSRAKIGRKNRGPNCPLRIDCHPCFCISCSYVSCVDANKSKQGHFNETGHMIGYCCKYGTRMSLFCYKCDSLIDELIELGSGPDQMIIPLEFTRKQPKVSTVSLPKALKKKLISHLHPIIYCRGLFNFSKTCYINCIMQVLVHTPLISNFFVGTRLPLPSRKRNSEGELTLTSVFQALFQEFQMNESKGIVPALLLYCIWLKMPHIGSNKQHDAHEFFIAVINMLHQEFIQPKGADGSVSNQSLIDRVFLGRLQSEVICNVCGHSRYTDDPFLDASLEVMSDKPQGAPIELCELLHRFTRLEHLDDSNLLYCPYCVKPTKSTKQLSFKELPEIVCLQLKRFRLSPRGFTKVKTKVHTPDSIDFSPYKSGPRNDSKRFHSDLPNKPLCPWINPENDWYYLHAIVNHYGSYSSGHYKTYIRKYSGWFVFDDLTVQRVSQEEALQKEGYLLFYKKGHPLFDCT